MNVDTTFNEITKEKIFFFFTASITKAKHRMAVTSVMATVAVMLSCAAVIS